MGLSIFIGMLGDQGEGAGWRRDGIAAFSGVRLLHGAKHAVAQRAALVFA